MAKKKKWPYKYVTVDALRELEGLTKEDLIGQMLRYDTNAKAEKKNKKKSEAIANDRAIIKEHRDVYVANNVNDFEDAKEGFEHAKTLRDAEIVDAIESKAALEKGFTDVIKNFEEHKDVCLKILKGK